MNRETDTVLLQTIGKFIQVQVQLAVAPLLQKIEEQNQLITVLYADADERDKEFDGAIEGISAEIARVERSINDLPKPEVINGKDGRDGKDAEPIDYQAIKETMVHLLQDEVAKFSIIDGKDGKDGKDADMDLIKDRIDFLFTEYQKCVPVPRDGINGIDGKDGKDGADVVAAFRDSDGHLVLTLSNGTVKDIGAIHGKDGAPGKDGKDGRDGFSLEDFEIVKIDHRTIKMYFARGELKKEFEFTFPVLIDRGVWKQGDYKTGDVVTFGGSMFIAQTDTNAKPETNSDWRLAVKRGRDGADGKDGPPGKQGPSGKNGRDLTQLGPDGSKWG